MAVTSRIDVNGNHRSVGNPIPHGSDINAPAAFKERNVGLLRHHQFGVNAPKLEVFKDGAGNLPVVGVLPQNSVWRALARGFNPVTVIEQNLLHLWE